MIDNPTLMNVVRLRLGSMLLLAAMTIMPEGLFRYSCAKAFDDTLILLGQRIDLHSRRV